MTRTRTRLAIVGIALLVVASAVPLSPSGGTAAAAQHTFVVEQGNRCFEVSPLSNGEDAASFYDYRNIENSDGDERYTYSSYMPRHLPESDTSRLFLYDGPNGVSLVIVHNALGGDRGDGSAATFRFSGLPSGGDWIVMDDDYYDQDDRFSRNRIDWSWYGDRTDGAVFRGLDRGSTEVTISPAFDERAALYDSPVDRDGNIRAWQFLTGSVGNPSAVGLDMTEPITIRTGYCGPDETPPTAALSGENGVAGHPVSFDASGTTDNRGISEYRWDFDGDGTTDRTTRSPTVAHEYAAAGTYNATVTAIDEGGNADRARVRVSVEADDPPNASLRIGDSPTQSFPVTLDASDATDDVGIAAYRWDLDGDGQAERQTDSPTISHTFEESGEYEVGLTVVDSGGQNDTATRSVSVGADDPPTPAIRVVSPEIPAEDRRIVFDASNATDDVGIAAHRWEFGDNGTATGERVAYTYDENGTYTVALTVVDEGGNNATATTEIEVRPPDTTPPEANLSANASRTEAGQRVAIEAGGSVSLDAGRSSDDRRIAEYRWDFDGDGRAERTTDSPTVARTYDSPGTYDAAVTVADAGGNAASANVTVRVFPEDGTPPSAALSVESNRTKAGTKLTFDASNATDGQTAVAEYRWDFDGDNRTDRITANATTDHAYGSAGTYNATVVVADLGNNTDDATVRIEVEPNEQAHSGGGSGGSSGGASGGGSSLGPPPVDIEPEKTGPNAGLVDVRNARSDETVRSSLPATAAAAESGVEFRTVGVDLRRDDAHFVVETARPGVESAEKLPADEILGSLSVAGKYVRSRQVSGVTYEVAIERSRLADAGLEPADLTAYQLEGGDWKRANLTVVSRDQTVVVRVEADALAPIAVGAERSVTVADAELAAGTVSADEPVSATATLENEGDSATEFAAVLRADGEAVASENVTVPAGESTQVAVNATLAPGTYELSVAGQSVGNVTVAEPTAEIAVADVSLNESTVSAGERVEITATVENAGTAAGEREIALALFGEQVATEVVDVPAGEREQVTFVRSVDAAGNYSVVVGNASATLAVSKPGGGSDEEPTAPDVPGFGVGVAVVALLVAALLVRLRAESR